MNRKYEIKRIDSNFGRTFQYWSVSVLPLDGVCCEPKEIAQFQSNDDAELFVSAKEGSPK